MKDFIAAAAEILRTSQPGQEDESIVDADALADLEESIASPKVWIVSLEWNQPPSEVTGDTGIVGVFANEATAQAAGHAERFQLDAEGTSVYQFSMCAGRYCSTCGQETEQLGSCVHECTAPDEDDDAFCDHCGAETNDRGSCDNNHDEWDVDVHVTEHEVSKQ